MGDRTECVVEMFLFEEKSELADMMLMSIKDLNMSCVAKIIRCDNADENKALLQ